MNLKDYQQQASRTIPDMKNIDLLTMSVISLTEEIGELMDANGNEEVISECGDICWYVSAIARSLNIDLCDRIFLETAFNGEDILIKLLYKSSSKISGIVKKSIWHGHKMEKYEIGTQLIKILEFVAMYANINGKTLKQVFNINIDKLKKRYPEGFSQERSIYRLEHDGRHLNDGSLIDASIERMLDVPNIPKIGKKGIWEGN